MHNDTHTHVQWADREDSGSVAAHEVPAQTGASPDPGPRLHSHLPCHSGNLTPYLAPITSTKELLQENLPVLDHWMSTSVYEAQ